MRKDLLIIHFLFTYIIYKTKKVSYNKLDGESPLPITPLEKFAYFKSLLKQRGLNKESSVKKDDVYVPNS